MNYKELTKLGLTDGEAKVYIALLKLQSSTVGPIVKESNIAYSNIYDVLDRLSDKGLVSYVTKNKTKYFQTTEPYQLEEYLEKKSKEIKNQKQKLSKIMPELIFLNQKTDDKLDAEIFIGYKGVKTAFAKLVEGYEEGEYVFFYQNYDEAQEKQVDMFFISLLSILYKPGIKFKGVSDHSYKNSIFLKKANYVEMRFVDFPIIGNIDICNGKVLITTWGKVPSSFLIHSKEIAENLTNYFNFVWNMEKVPKKIKE